MALIMLNRSFNKANILWLLNKGRQLNSKNHIASLDVLQSKLPALPYQQMSVKPFSRSTISCSDTEKGHSHVQLWALERILATSMLGLIPAAFIIPHPSLDYLLSLSLVVHIHWGMEAIVVDYIRPAVFGQTIPKISIAALYFFSAFTLGGLFYFNYSDVGLVNAIKMFWAL